MLNMESNHTKDYARCTLFATEVSIAGAKTFADWMYHNALLIHHQRVHHLGDSTAKYREEIDDTNSNPYSVALDLTAKDLETLALDAKKVTAKFPWLKPYPHHPDPLTAKLIEAEGIKVLPLTLDQT